MVSRRNFFAIAAIMLVVLFMFQFTNVALELWNNYGDNGNAVDVYTLAAQGSAYVPDSPGEETPWGTVRPGVAFLGPADSAVGQVTAQWAAYTKRSFAASTRLEGYAPGPEVPELIVLDGAGMGWDSGTCGVLRSFAAAGASLVFATLPDVSVIQESEELQDLLGIYEVRAQRTTVEGFHLYAGFLLGGEAVYQGENAKENEQYQDMELDLPWYILGPGTKAYMKGIPAGEEKAEDHPAVIWRRSLGGAYVFAVNGSYMEDAAGLGLLSAMASEAVGYSVYPVVNAQNLVAANYPGLASENGTVLSRYYSLSMRGLYRDVLWPDITAMYHRGGLGLSCMMSIQFDYDDNRQPDQGQLVYYMKLINELGAEPGLSLYSVSDTPVSRRLSENFSFLTQSGMDYQFTSLYGGGLTAQEVVEALGWAELAGVRTVMAPYDGGSQVVGYQTEHVTRQMAVTDGFDHTYMADFRVRCLETALAYTSVLVDAARPVYPESSRDTWDAVFQRMASDVPSGWEAFEAFDATTASQSDGRIRDFLALDYTHSYEGSEVSIQHSGSGTAWFLLRVPSKEVAGVDGGSFRKVEEGAYLIEAREGSVTVNLRPAGPG